MRRSRTDCTEGCLIEIEDAAVDGNEKVECRRGEETCVMVLIRDGLGTRSSGRVSANLRSSSHCLDVRGRKGASE